MDPKYTRDPHALLIQSAHSNASMHRAVVQSTYLFWSCTESCTEICFGFFFEIIAFDHLRLLSKSRKKSEKENTVFIFICLRIKSARVFVLMVFYSHNYFVNYGHIRYNLISID